MKNTITGPRPVFHFWVLVGSIGLGVASNGACNGSIGANGTGGVRGAAGESQSSGAPASETGNPASPLPTAPGVDGGGAPTASDGGGAMMPAPKSGTICPAGGGAAAAVATPKFVRNIPINETGWFGSALITDLAGDGKKEIVAALQSLWVFDAKGQKLGRGTDAFQRVFASPVVADLDGDGVKELIVGGMNGTVAAYEFKNGALSRKAGWPASTCSAGQCPETRGLAAADLDHDGKIEVVAVTTNTVLAGGAQVFVFSANGKLYQPAGVTFPAWPRYDTRSGPGGDATFNGAGNVGFGCYGENVAIGNVDDDPDLEIVVTYDNHRMNVFKKDGTSVLAAPFFTNPLAPNVGRRLGWGQFARWLDPAVEATWYNQHGAAPDVNQTGLLQWTASPPNVVDLDGDGKNEVVGVPNVEMHEPYVTEGYAFVALEGAHGDGSLTARRMPGFDKPPFTGKPLADSYDQYPPRSIPAPVTVDIVGDPRPEILAPVGDGLLYAVSPDGAFLWKYDYAKGVPSTYASEPVVADLNRDGTPEIVFGTYSNKVGGGRIVVLSNAGALLFDVPLGGQIANQNGVGVAAAPAIGDLDGDGALEIVVTTMDHGIDVYTVPGSTGNCLLWPTGRGGALRTGSGPSTAP